MNAQRSWLGDRMAILTIEEARAAGRIESARLRKSATAALNEAVATSANTFDVFLSHSRLDSVVVLGVKRIIESTGKTVYVDWIDDPQLDRSNVTAATAAALRGRMRQSKSLFYAHSGNATKSRWMPWELGYFDGYNGNVAIFPLTATKVTQYRGEEYLGLYPYVDVTGTSLFIHKNQTEYRGFDSWRNGVEKLRPAA